jgi:hypothetical protein
MSTTCMRHPTVNRVAVQDDATCPLLGRGVDRLLHTDGIGPGSSTGCGRCRAGAVASLCMKKLQTNSFDWSQPAAAVLPTPDWTAAGLLRWSLSLRTCRAPSSVLALTFAAGVGTDGHLVAPPPRVRLTEFTQPGRVHSHATTFHIRFSRAPSPQTCQSNGPPSLSWSSTSRRRRPSA